MFDLKTYSTSWSLISSFTFKLPTLFYSNGVKNKLGISSAHSSANFSNFATSMCPLAMGSYLAHNSTKASMSFYMIGRSKASFYPPKESKIIAIKIFKNT